MDDSLVAVREGWWSRSWRFAELGKLQAVELRQSPLDRRFGMIPTEGYGLSNNPKVMGPPSFEDSAFEVPAGEPTRVTLEMRY